MHTPVCKMYGNRRPLSCIPRRNAQPVSDSFVPSRQDSPANSRPNSGNNVKADSQAKGADGFDESGRLGETANGAAAHERPGVGGEKLSPAQQELKEALENDRRRRRSAEERQTDEREWERLSKRQAGVQLNVDAWEACPKVLASEYHDYFEFILCNAAFAAIAGIVLVFRQRALALRQFGRLAARIMQTQVS
ncbi:hypothetical protein Rt10032_c04g2097 [Rhodotorula toruloides]|uniref:Transmembrane protein n=1 Tax=Rhodotorula toruloides TaxID=5286 RepID=A0A511KCH7_RHOTO|nr:hypothetical protein Rt10032_c04g2097 [Rhodotorula toruloides]